jgi:predicted CopG family antitoxin
MRSISLSSKPHVYEKLNALKVHHREPFGIVIKRLIDYYERSIQIDQSRAGSTKIDQTQSTRIDQSRSQSITIDSSRSNSTEARASTGLSGANRHDHGDGLGDRNMRARAGSRVHKYSVTVRLYFFPRFFRVKNSKWGRLGEEERQECVKRYVELARGRRKYPCKLLRIDHRAWNRWWHAFDAPPIQKCEVKRFYKWLIQLLEAKGLKPEEDFQIVFKNSRKGERIAGILIPEHCVDALFT